MSGAHPSVLWFGRIVRERCILRGLIVPGLMFLSIALLSGGLTLLRRSPTGTIGDPKRTAPDADKALHVEPAELDVGTVWAEPGFHHRFRLLNSSRAPVVVERVAADCDCTHVSPASFALGPGAAQTIDIDIDLTRLAKGRDSRTRKVLDTTVGFVLSDGRIENFQLRGTVAFAFSAPSTILITAPLLFGEPADAEQFTIWTDSRIVQLSVIVDPADAELAEVPGMSTRQSKTFYLRPNTHRTVGRFGFDVSVRASADDGQEFGPLPIRVTGRMESDVAWSPQDVLLLWTASGVAPREDVVFWSRSGQPFEVVDVIGEPDFLHVDVSAPRSAANAMTQTVSLSGAQPVTSRSFGTVLLRVRTRDNSDLKIPSS